MKYPILQKFGTNAVLLDWANEISANVREYVFAMNQFIQKKHKEEIIETVTTYHSIAVYLRETISVEKFIESLTLAKTPSFANPRKIRTVYIPVCYEAVFAPDLDSVANLNSLTKQEVISLHSEGIYIVEFIGFLPGFPYLSGLNKRLHVPRRSTPLQFIDKGSVGIGGAQTGIYTMDSPGGWLIIGRSPLDFFSIKNDPPSLLNASDIVHFCEISENEFITIQNDVRNGTFKVEEEVNHD